MIKQRLLLLGATGSIGVSTLDVVARHPDRFEVFALTAQRRTAELEAQCLRWKPRYAALADVAAANDLRQRLREHGLETEVLSGAAAAALVFRGPDAQGRPHFQVLNSSLRAMPVGATFVDPRRRV